MGKRPFQRRIFGKLGLVGLVLILLALAFELAARMAFPPPQYFHGLPYDPELGYRPPTNSHLGNSDEEGAFPFRLNAWGFRGPDLPSEPKPAGAQRLIFLGDSFLQGWQVREEDLAPQACAQDLRERGEVVESYGLACDGYGTIQQTLLLRKYGADLDPDAIVVCMYVANDIIDNSKAMVGRTLMSQGAYLRPFFRAAGNGQAEVTWIGPLRTALRQRSRAFQLIESRFLRGGQLEAQPRVPGVALDPIERIASGLLPFAYYDLYRRQDSEEGADEHWESAWRDTELAFTALREEAHKLGVPLLVALIPHKNQVQSDGLFVGYNARVQANGHAPIEARVDWNAPEKRLMSMLERLDVPCLSLLEALRDETRETGRSMYLRDGHWSGRGHRLAGREIARALVALRERPGLESDAHEGIDLERRALTGPFDLPAQVWQEVETVDFERTQRPELLGRGWLGWRSDWWGSEPGWMMGPQAGLLVPDREGTLVIHGWLPEFAPFPMTFTIQGVEEVIEGPGSFTVRRASTKSAGAPYRFLYLQADRTFEPWPGRVASMVLQGMAFEPRED